MKQTIMNYILALKYSSLGNHVSTRGYLEVLENLIEDMPEESTDIAEDKTRYIKRITELEDENKSAKEKCENLRLGNVIMFNKLADNDKTMDKYQEEISELYVELRKAPVSATLSLQAELQELKSKLAETEESLQNMMDNESRLNKRVGKAELSEQGWRVTCVEFAKENDELRDQLAKLRGPQWID